VKLSGCIKVSRQLYPHADLSPYIGALLDAFGPDHCVWASDWPFLRMPERVDYGPLLALLAHQVPDEADRRRILWDTPRREFDFPLTAQSEGAADGGPDRSEDSHAARNRPAR
jgi:predicted TIM-barrel fold metal-dependent hydrolase